MDEKLFFNARAKNWAHVDDEKRMIMEKVIDMTQIHQGDKVLDVGCGAGVLYPLLMEIPVNSYTGMDISDEMLEQFKEATGINEKHLICGDFQQPLHLDEEVDLIIIFNSIPHFDDLETVFTNAKNNLAGEGSFVIAHGRTRAGIKKRHEEMNFSLGRDAIPKDEVLKELCNKHGFQVTKIEDEEFFYFSCKKKEEEFIELEDVHRAKALWNPGRLLLVTVLFSVLASAPFFLMNYHRLDMKKEKRKWTFILLLGMPIIYVMTMVAILLGNELIGRVVGQGATLGIGIWMYLAQKDIYSQHLHQQGKKASGWWLALSAMVVLVVCIIIAVWASFFEGEYTILKVADDAIYYNAGIEEYEAKELGHILSKTGYLIEDEMSIAVVFESTERGKVISFVVEEAYIDEPEVTVYFKELKGRLSQTLPAGNTMDYFFVDENLKFLKIIG